MIRSPLSTRLCRWLGALALAASAALPAQAAIPAQERQALIDLYNSTDGDGWIDNTGWKTGGNFSAAGTECSWFGITCDAGGNHVTEIVLVDNNLSDTLPSLSGLTALFHFNVSRNQLTGSIPSLDGLTALGYFNVSFNQLTGVIPSLSGLTSLTAFTVDENKLTGSIPSLSGLTALTAFNASVNQLTGSIPSLSGLTALNYFYVSYNQLTGSIPSLNGLTALSNFNISNNQLTGSIPSLDGLTALEYFNVFHNQLTGSVPTPPAFLRSGWLCPNHLTHVDSNDWDGITGTSPWYRDCPTVPTYTITFNAGAGTVTPPASGYTGAPGDTHSFGITPPAGHEVARVSSTCGIATGQPAALTPGPLTSFTTLPLIADCQVDVSYSVLPVDGACGAAHGLATMTAPTANLCTAGTETSVSGTGPWSWSCTGAGGGTDASCSAPPIVPVTHFEGASPTGSGTVTVGLTGGGQFCGFTGTPALIAAAPGATPVTPAGIAFPHGLFSFTASNCTPGSTITLTMKLPATVPDTAKYWKWGPTSDNTTAHWYEMPATIDGDTVSFSITDGGQGDSDLDAANGSITDPGGIGVPEEVVPPGTVPVITSGAPPAGSVGQPYSFMVTATGTAPLRSPLAR